MLDGGASEKATASGTALGNGGSDIDVHFFLLGPAIVNEEASFIRAIRMLLALGA
jgi:hypothetical protein